MTSHRIIGYITIIAVVLFLSTFISFFIYFVYSEKRSRDAPELTCKYTIHIGSAAFAIGKCADSYIINDATLEFTDKRRNKGVIVPLSSVYYIEED